MKLTANTDRKLIPAGEAAERILRLAATAPEGKKMARLPLNLALVIDRSGSMDGEKLERAKEAAIHCLRSMTSADRCAIVVYDDKVDTIARSAVLSAEAKNLMIGAVRRINSGGSTNLSGGWLQGAQEVARHTDGGGYLSRVILLSDGLANAGITDIDELAKHAEELRKRGVSTTTMGVGADFNEDLMERIALRGGGHFYYVETARQIPDTFAREIGEVLSTVARNVSLELELPRKVSAELLNNYVTESSGGGEIAPSRLHVRLDDMIAGETRAAIFKLHIPATEEGREWRLRAWLRYTDVESGESKSETFSDIVLRAASAAAAAAEQRDNEVTSEAALLDAARSREEALTLDRAGDYAASAAVLARSAQELRAAPAPTAAMLADADQLDSYANNAPGGLGAKLRKAMHYERNTRQQNRKA